MKELSAMQMQDVAGKTAHDSSDSSEFIRMFAEDGEEYKALLLLKELVKREVLTTVRYLLSNVETFCE